MPADPFLGCQNAHADLQQRAAIVTQAITDIDCVMEQLRIRFASAQDAECLAPVLQDMQRHYGVPSPPREQIVADLANLPAGNRILVAFDHQAPVAFAAFAEIYPGPFLRRGLFLKEIYVVPHARKTGLGRALIRHLAEWAVENGYARIDWTADSADAPLLDFYDGLGGARLPKKLFYRLDGAALTAAAKR